LKAAESGRKQTAPLEVEDNLDTEDARRCREAEPYENSAA
jgi:hypothetical protein